MNTSSNTNDTPTVPSYKHLPPENRFPLGTSADACPVFDDLVNCLRTMSPRSYDGYFTAVALFVLSTIAARRVYCSLGKTRYTNLQILLIGRTGLSAKSTVASLSTEILRQIGLDFLLIPDLITPQKLVNIMTTQSPEGYEKFSSDEKAMALLKIGFSGQRGWYHDEFGTTLSGMMRTENVNSLYRGLFRMLDDANDKFQLAGIIRGVDEIKNPYLAFLGCLTIADLIPFCLKGTMLWNDGFLARMVLIASDDNLIKGVRFPRGKLKFPPEILKSLVEWHQRLGMPEVQLQPNLVVTRPKGHELTLSMEVENAFYDYDDTLREILSSQDCQDLDGNYVRFAEKALRVAMLFASLSGSMQIEICHWAKAQEITEFWRENLHELYRQIITKVPPRKIPVTERVFRSIIVKGNPNRRDIEIHTGLKSTEVQEALDKLVQLGEIRQIDCINTVRYEIVPKVSKKLTDSERIS